jgi:transposase
MTKRELTDSQWDKIRPLLSKPKRSRRGGRPPANDRDCLEGILWVLRSGARWRDLPKDFPSPTTCWRRLCQWEEQDVWLNIWRAFLGELDAAGLLDWEETFADGSFAPAKKGALASERPNAARVQSGWWWATARVFLWEFTSIRPRPTKSRSSKKR